MQNILLFLFADSERRPVVATTKGHQQTWGQVSPHLFFHYTNIRFVTFADSESLVKVSFSSAFVCLCVRHRPMVPSMSIHVCFPCVVVLVVPWFRPCLGMRLPLASSFSYSYHGSAHVSVCVCVRLRPMVPSMSIHVWVYVCISSSSYSYHGSAHVCVRLRPMVPSMFIHAFAPCVVVLVLPWFRPCLCV